MKQLRKGTAYLLILVLTLTGMQIMPQKALAAKKKTIKLSAKKITLQVGKSKKLTVKNKKGSVKWKTSNKKVATVSKKGVVKAKKKGKATITAQVKNGGKIKKLKCKVTVKASKKAETQNPSQEEQLVVSATPMPNVNQTSTVPMSTPTPEPTETVKAEGFFTIAKIRYVKAGYKVYQKKGILQTELGAYTSLKEKLPETEKIQLDVTYKGIEYGNITVSDVVWHEEPYYSSGADNGYYQVRVTIPYGGKNVYCDFFIVEIITQETYNVSGILKDNSQQVMANKQLIFMGNSSPITTKTDENGKYSVMLPREEYNDYEVYYYTNYKATNRITTISVTESTDSCDMTVENLYSVTGVVTRGSSPWRDEWVSVYPADASWPCVEETKTNEQDGSYQLYLTTGTYDIYIASMKIATIEVGTENLNYDIQTNLCKISGTLKTVNGEIVPNQSIYFEDEENSRTISTSQDGTFSCYMEPNEYSLKFRSGMDSGMTIVVSEDMENYDIEAELYKVSGKVYNFEKLWDIPSLSITYDMTGGGSAGEYIIVTNGSYCEYLPSGTYKISAGGITSGNSTYGSSCTKYQELVVTNENVEKDFKFSYYLITGKLIQNQDVQTSLYANPALSVYDSNGEQIVSALWLNRENYGDFVTEPGTYTVKFKGLTIDTITVSEEITNHDITCNMYKVSGTIAGLDYSGGWYYQTYFINEKGEETRVGGFIYGSTGEYTVHLPAGKYKVVYKEGSTESNLGTINVADENLTEQNFSYGE